MDKDFLIVDFEFTQYTKNIGRPRGFFSEILEIGAVKINGASLASEGQIKAFVKPHFYPKQAKEGMDFCMITEQDMKQGIEFSQMIDKLCELYVSGKTYFVAWGDEDYKVIAEGCKRHKIDNPIAFEDYLDLAAAYKELKGDTYTTGLKKATEEQNVATGGLWHTAYDDANNTGKLLVELLNKGWQPQDYFNKLDNLK